MLLHDAGEENLPILLMSGRDDLPQIAGRMGAPYFSGGLPDLEQFLELFARALGERVAPSTA